MHYLSLGSRNYKYFMGKTVMRIIYKGTHTLLLKVANKMDKVEQKTFEYALSPDTTGELGQI